MFNSWFTKSIKAPPKATGSFEFVIHDWSYHMNKNDLLQSPVFKIGETEEDASQWCIEVLPSGGLPPDPSNNVIVHVINKSLETRYAYITVKLHQFVEEDQKSELKLSDTALVTSSLQELDRGKKWVVRDFIPTAAISEQANGFLSNDSVIFKVCISEITCGRKTKEAPFTNEQSNRCGHEMLTCSSINRTTLLPVERGLATDLQNLLTSSLILPQIHHDFSDICVCSKEDNSLIQMNCHKVILAARSCILSNKFADPMFGIKYAFAKGFKYPMDVKEVCFKDFITFLYTDKIELSVLEEHADQLLIAATRYHVPKLISICCKHLINNLTTESVSYILQLGTRLHNQWLRKHCITYMTLHMEEIVNTSGWKSLSGDISTLQSILDMSMDPTCALCRSEKNSILTSIISNQNKNSTSVLKEGIEVESNSTSLATSPPSTPQDTTGPFSYKNVLIGSAPFKSSTRQRFSFQSPLAIQIPPIPDVESISPIDDY